MDLDFSPHFRGLLNFQRSLNTLQYYTGTQNGVFIIEVSSIQRSVIERFHCSFPEISQSLTFHACTVCPLYAECADPNILAHLKHHVM